jgi:hypothetical protein
MDLLYREESGPSFHQRKRLGDAMPKCLPDSPGCQYLRHMYLFVPEIVGQEPFGRLPTARPQEGQTMREPSHRIERISET